MSATTPDETGSALVPARLEPRPANLARDPFDAWQDEMIKRMSGELRKQLSQIEAQKAHPNQTATERAANARTLATLQRTMAQLSRHHKEHAAARADTTENNVSYKTALIGHLSCIIAELREGVIPGAAERD